MGAHTSELSGNGTVKKRKAKAFPFFVALLVGMLLLCGGTIWIGLHPSDWLMRQMYEVRGERAVPEEILLLLITDESIQKLGLSRRAPIPYELVQQGINSVLKGGAKALFLDRNIFSAAADEKRVLDTFSGKRVYLLADELGASIGTFIAAMTSDESGALSPPHGAVSPNVYGPAQAVPRVALWKILSETEGDAPQQLQGKVVFFGLASLSYLQGQRESDRIGVPYAPEQMFEVEFQATVYGNLLDTSWIRELPFTYVFLILIALGVGATVVVLLNSFQVALIILLGMSSLVLLALYFSFAWFFLWTPYAAAAVVLPLLALLLKGMKELPETLKTHADLKDTFSLD